MSNQRNSITHALLCSLLIGGLVNSANAGCEDAFHARIIDELNRAYQAQGRPATTVENLRQVKDEAMTELEADARKWPKEVSYSISVLNDAIAVYVTCQDGHVRSEWRPN
jgi:hypothetical protein